MPIRPPTHGQLTRPSRKPFAEWQRTHKRRSSSGLYGRRWRRARAMFLARNPLCLECAKAGTDAAATVVDHIEPHRGDKVKFWDESNWQPLCKEHHDLKTIRGQ